MALRNAFLPTLAADWPPSEWTREAPYELGAQLLTSITHCQSSWTSITRKMTSSAHAACPAGSYKGALVMDPFTGGDDVYDYHWYRQDQGGYWSHKPGWGEATNVDASGQVISDPRLANRDYTDSSHNSETGEATGYNYSQFGGFFCVPTGTPTGGPLGYAYGGGHASWEQY